MTKVEVVPPVSPGYMEHLANNSDFPSSSHDVMDGKGVRSESTRTVGSLGLTTTPSGLSRPESVCCESKLPQDPEYHQPRLLECPTPCAVLDVATVGSPSAGIIYSDQAGPRPGLDSAPLKF